MALQAFLDDSYDEGATYVLAGHIASVEAWAAFSAEWAQLLPGCGVPDRHGRYHFKMKEMAVTPDRVKRIPGFFRVIEKHALLSLSVRIHAGELARARSRIYVPGLSINWGILENPFLTSFRILIDGLHEYRTKPGTAIPLSERVNFYFDNHPDKEQVRSPWYRYIRDRPELGNGYGAAPHFVDDRNFLPLQAASLWAWWRRKWDAEGMPKKSERSDFGKWSGLRPSHPRLDLALDENRMAQKIKFMVAELIEPGRQIYDVRTSFGAPRMSR